MHNGKIKVANCNIVVYTNANPPSFMVKSEQGNQMRDTKCVTRPMKVQHYQLSMYYIHYVS